MVHALVIPPLVRVLGRAGRFHRRVARAIEWASQNAPQVSDPDKLVISKPDVKSKARSV